MNDFLGWVLAAIITAFLFWIVLLCAVPVDAKPIEDVPEGYWTGEREITYGSTPRIYGQKYEAHTNTDPESYYRGYRHGIDAAREELEFYERLLKECRENANR